MIYLKLIININGKSIQGNNMTKNETKKTVETNPNEKILGSLKANENARKILFLATNISNNLMKLVPKMAKSVNEIITEIDTKQKGKIKGQIDLAFLRSHLYNLASYDRKTSKNSAFEMAVTRSVKLGILMNTESSQFSATDTEILIMDKIATPMVEVKKAGQKGGVSKVANTSEQLVPVHTGIIDKVWSTKFAVQTRSSKTKDTKINFQQLSSNFLNELESVWKLADKKDYNKLLEIVDEKTIENLGNISALLSDNSIRSAWIKASDNLSVDGNVKKSA